MAHDPLATAADLAARKITVGEDETALAGILLAEASAAVREAAGCPISEVTSDDVEVPGTRGCVVELPGRQITRVESVKIGGVTATGWLLRRDGSLYRAAGWLGPGGVWLPITATITHGLPEVPADIVGLVCSLTRIALAASRQSDGGLPPLGMTAERMSNWQGSWEGSDTRPQHTIVIGAATRRDLRRRFGGSTASMVKASR